jgi:hypothetical protein
MFDDNFLRDLERQGLTVADALRALRPGSGMDRLTYTTHCIGCGATASESIRWFHEREFACRCGSHFDGADVERFIALLRRGEVAAARAITSIQPIIEQTDDDE